MVSAEVPLPVVKSVAETVAVQPAPNPRSSVTWTVPRLALRVPPGAAEPRAGGGRGGDGERPGDDADGDGAAPPLVQVGGQVLPGAVEVTVLVRAPLPVSGLFTVMV